MPKDIHLTPKSDDDFQKVAIVLYKAKKYKEALINISKAIQLSPKRASFHNYLGIIFIALQQKGEAEKAFRKAIELNYEEWDAWFNLGLININKNIIDEALQCMQRVTSAQTNREEAWTSLAYCQLQLNEYANANISLQNAIKLNPTSNTAWKLIGNLQYQEGQYQESIESLRKCSNENDNDTELLRLKARTHIKLNNLKQAYKLCDKALELEPSHPENLSQLVTLYVHLNQYEKAKDIIEDMMAKKENDPILLGQCGMLYAQKLNQYDKGIAYLRKSLGINSENLDVKSALAGTLIICGKLEEAENHLKQIIETNPEHATAYRQLAHIKKMGKGDSKSIEELESVLGDSQLDLFQRSEIQYALADAYDQIGEHEKAFYNLVEANAFDKKRNPFNYKKVSDSADASIEFFTKDFFKQNSHHGSNSERPIFIFGMPRSGTTLTEQILASHPNVYGAGELKDIGELRKRINHIKQSAPYPYNLHQLELTESQTLAQRYLDVLESFDKECRFVTDKMPFNFYAIGLIQFLFPKAKLIYCKRNPLDNCLSCFFLRFADKMAFSTDLNMLGKVYKIHEKLMKHWHEVIPSPIHTVEYEQMINNHEQTCRELLTFCDLEWDERCLSFYETERPVKTASNWQVRQPIYNSSLGRWIPYREGLQPLIEELDISAELLSEWLKS